MAESLRIAMVVSEMYPFAKSGGLGDVLGSLPQALARRGHEVSVFLPAYSRVFRQEGFAPASPARVADAFGGVGLEFSVHRKEQDGVAVYAVGCGELFERAELYGEPGGEYPDNALRFTRFCRGVLSFLGAVGGLPDVLHCHDWQAALIPPLVRTVLQERTPWRGVATVFTIHNLAYQGRFGSDQFPHTGLPAWTYSFSGVEYYGDLNLMKGAILFADVVSTVSERYAQEIQTVEQGEGLHGVVIQRTADLYGIMNGIDVSAWDPSKDGHLAAPFSVSRPSGKQQCRQALRRELSLATRVRGPLCALISRLASQKGIELLLDAIDDIVFLGVQVACLGTGDGAYVDALARAAERHRGQVAFVDAFDEGLAHRMYAGADVLAMPSRYEPAGLNQLYAMRYGTLPVVRAVGGLADSVTAHREPDPEHDTGFQFRAFSPAEFLWCMVRVCRVFGNKRLWRRMVRNAMQRDSGWDAVSPRYEELYAAARERLSGRW